jgi:hypothetical protein
VWLRVLTGPDAGKIVRVTGEAFVVGRSRGCDLVLHGPDVEGRHACFGVAGPGRYALRDLGSERGTFVAGRRIRSPVELTGEERLCFGDTFAQLSRVAPSARRRRRVAAVGIAAAAAVAAAGVTAGVLAPRTGGGPVEAVHHAAAPPAAPAAGSAGAAEAPVEPAAETVAGAAPAAGADGEATGAGGATAGEGGVPTVFREDFSDPLTGWEVFETPTVKAGYERGAYVIRITDSTWYATVDSGRAFASPVLTVTVRNPGRATKAGFGVLCRYRSESRFDVLAVGTDGTYAILRQRGGSLTVQSGGGQWLHSARVPVGAERYRLRAECRDDLMRLWVNGRQVVAQRLRGLDGRIGLFAAGLGEFRFDDVVVESRL